MDIRLRAKLIAVALGLPLICTAPAEAADLWAAELNNGLDVEINRYDASGAFVGGVELTDRDAIGGLRFVSPADFAGFGFDPARNLWAAELNNGLDVEINRYDASGAFVGGVELTDRHAIGGLRFVSPADFAGFGFDPAGNLWAAELNNGLDVEINRYDASGAFVGGAELRDPAVGGLRFVSPADFAGFGFDPAGNLWAAELNNGLDVEINRYDASGAFVGGVELTDRDAIGGLRFVSPADFAGFAFAPAPVAPAPVPELSSWSMLVVGFALFAAISRRGSRLLTISPPVRHAAVVPTGSAFWLERRPTYSRW